MDGRVVTEEKTPSWLLALGQLLRDLLEECHKTAAWKKFITTVPLENVSSVVFYVRGIKEPWILTNLGIETQLRGFARIVVPASGQVSDVIIMPLRKYVEERTNG